MTRRLLCLCLLGAAALAGGCQYLGGETTPYRPPAYYRLPDVAPEVEGEEAGRELYLRDCAFCHGATGRGTQYAPSLRHGTNGAALTDFMLRTGRMPLDHPEARVRAGDVVYTEKEIAALVDYVVAAFDPPGPDIPVVDPTAGKVSEGQPIYEQYCASCHAPTGIGGIMLTRREAATEGPAKSVLIPGLGKSDAVEIAEAVRTGPGAMPVFDEELVASEELESLVRYTLYLRHPNDAGGFPIEHVGPVAEGAVGWVLGLGLLVVFIRWIGVKAGATP